MQDDKFKVLSYAMHYGVALGFFWVFKYLFLIGSTYYSSLMFIYSFLGVGTCIVIPFLVSRYRDKANDGKISYLESIKFTVLLCFFGSLIEAVVAYLHFTEIDPSFVTSLNKTVVDWMQILKIDTLAIKEFQAHSYGAVAWLINQMFYNVLVGFIISLVFGLIISKQDKFK